jgi:hypothetical protein
VGLLRVFVVATGLAITLACRNDAGPAAKLEDPVAAAMPAVPPGQVGLFNFPDKIIFTNNTTDAVTDCVVLVDGSIKGVIQKAGAGVTVTLMRSRFEPYVEADEFYRRGSLNNNSIECTTPAGRSKVTFEGQVEYSATIPPKR